jgi:hypothetical protein
MKRTNTLLTILTLTFIHASSAVGHTVANPAAEPQALTPPYLSEFPSPERVMSAMQVADPRETALRQMGAFYQLTQIIKTLSGSREFRGFTPDEGRLIGAYDLAHYNVAQAADKSFPGPAGGSGKFSEQTPYRFGRWDPRFGIEGIQTFKTFLSPGLKAEFDKIIQSDNARRAARAQSDRTTSVAPQPTTAAPQQSAAVKPGSQEELRRCVASGRSQRVCFSEVMGNGLDQLTGISLKQPLAPGPRMTGDYSSAGGFRLIFQPDKVTMVCRGVPSPRPYTVEITNTQTLVQVQDGTKPVVFSLTQDGKLAGSGSIRVTGQVPAGSRTEETAGMTTQKTTRERQLAPGEERNYPNAQRNGQVYTVKEDASEFVYGPTGTRTVTDYVTKTADCNLGLMTPTGPTPLPPDIESPFGLITTIFSGASVLMKGGSTEAAAREMLNLDKAPPPGLRMTGRYAGASGFSITFHPESATVACGDAERAREYAVQRTGNQVLLKIQDSANPLTLQLKPDGSLFGEGTAQVNGRVMTGTTDDPNNPFVFAPKPGSCSVGSLLAGGAVTANTVASTSTSPSASAPAAASAPAPPNTGNATPVAAPASLSIQSGFGAQPGVVDPLAGKMILVIRDSFENILATAGSTPPGSSTRALTAWARACETRHPSCQQGIELVRPHLVASAQLDGAGRFTFPNARSGTYYLVGQTSYNGLHLVWNLRVDLKPGANSVTLDQRNTTPIDR